MQDQPFSESEVAYDPLTGQETPLRYMGGLSGEGVFVQDQWKMKPNLNLSMGIRWDDFGNPHGENGFKYSNIFLGQGSTIDEQFANASVFASQNALARIVPPLLIKNAPPTFGARPLDPRDILRRLGNWERCLTPGPGHFCLAVDNAP